MAETELGKNEQPANDKPTKPRRGRGRSPATSKRGGAASKPKRNQSSAGRDASHEGPGLATGEMPTAQPRGKGQALVIVESPAKAKTVGRFLGSGYRVRASVGHIRDLPENKMGVDIEHDFKPHYVLLAGKQKIIAELRELTSAAPVVFLATDPDREGEAISWHLAAVLNRELANKPVHRVEFHEITRDAIGQAFVHPRSIDQNRVDAQQARRILDRIVGYTISPLLSKKMSRKRLSAGRVQSVALRLVVEREREIEAFVAVEYWSIEAELAKKLADGARDLASDGQPRESFRARLIKVGEDEFECHTGADATNLASRLEKCLYRVVEVRRKDVMRNPNPPFITSTLQQEASRRLGFNPKRTMKVAQELYEGLPVGEEGNVGLITYMRTDSTFVAKAAQDEAREYIEKKFGSAYLPPAPRTFSKKVASAQEAHEAIRPTSTFREPTLIKSYLDADQFKLYDLIWKRFVASQMSNAIFDTTAVDIAANESERDKEKPDFLFRANGSLLKFPGFLAVYGRTAGDEDEEDDTDRRLPLLERNEALDLLGIYPEQHFTEPPPRYTEATLIKALEQHGIGRPSTFAPILSNIQERGYIEQIEKRRLKPTALGFAVNDLLVAHFGEVVDVGFTAQMEEKLDEIANGRREWVQLLREFYAPFKATLERAAQEMPTLKVEEEQTEERCDKCGAPMVIRRSKFGRFLSCSRFPQCKNAKSITLGVKCPECRQGGLSEKRSKKGRVFYSCSRYPDCKFAVWDKPLSEACPKCGGLLVQGTRGMVRCINGDYTTSLPVGAKETGESGEVQSE